MLSGRISFRGTATACLAVISWFVSCLAYPSGTTASDNAANPSTATTRATTVQKEPLTEDLPLAAESQVLTILAAKCSRCHGEKLRKADLDLSSAQAILKGSESGQVVVAGKPDESPLYEMVHSKQMPPKGEGALSESEIETIRKWITDGAKLPAATETSHVVTQHDIVPLMYLRCTVCHGSRRQEGGLDLRTRSSMLKGGKSGPALVPGKPTESLILKKIQSGAMPPRLEVVAVSIKPIEPPEVELLTRWIAAGAPETNTDSTPMRQTSNAFVSDEDRKFWSFQPPRRVNPPQVRKPERVANPIDAFVLSKLEAKGLELSPIADKTTIIRRAWFDLLGLPPTPLEVDAVLADQTEDWYSHMIERLLASPRYGERWGRYWLDLAGYSDSQGIQDSDIIRPEAYRYRDYVIRSFNADKPYDRFLQEQIAGDELDDYENAPVISNETYDNLVATGFLRMSADGTHANITNFVPDRLEVIAHEIEVLTSATMGLTIKCARCHSHKFDPIPHEDYYRLLAIFKGAMDEHDWMNPETARFLPFVTTPERTAWETREKSIRAEIDSAKGALEKLKQELTAKYVEERIGKLPAEVQNQIRPLLKIPKEQQSAEQKALFAKYERDLIVSDDELKKSNPAYQKLTDETASRTKGLDSQRQPEPRIRALWDRGSPSPTYLLKRGNYLTPGRLVEPGPPSVLSDGQTPFVVTPISHKTEKTGRRLAFAQWLTRPEHPLTSRVMVNRIWEHHFGMGLVETTDNFGKTGTPPTHPELLDWLATEFVGQGWSLKAMHRVIMNSNTYRQASSVSPLHEKLDPENRLLARMPVRRLEAEPLYDSLIAVSGRLNSTPFGLSDLVDVRNDGLVTTRGVSGTWRRSVYVLQRRTTIPTLLENFDLPGMSPNCVQRRQSNVAPQALQLLNNGFVHELASHFAERVRSAAGDSPEKQLEYAYRLAYGRPPTDEERQLTLQSLRTLAAQWVLENGGQTHVVPATTHLWIRESAPETVYEDDLVSVWSSKSGDGARRYGLIEFDVAAFKNLPLHSASLELGILNESRLKQSASLIAPEISNLHWKKYQETKSATAVPLKQLGRIDLQVRPGMLGQYAKSSATTADDLRELVSRIQRDGKVAFVLTADEEGIGFQQDWDDGVHPQTRRNPPRLVLRDTNSDSVSAQRHALHNLCRALMNSAEFLYVD